MKLVREHINEKFTQDTDPVDDLKIGYPFLGELNYGTIVKITKRLYTITIDNRFNIYVDDNFNASGWFSENWYGIVLRKKIEKGNVILRLQTYAENYEDAKFLQKIVLDKTYTPKTTNISIPLNKFKEHFQIIK